MITMKNAAEILRCILHLVRLCLAYISEVMKWIENILVTNLPFP